MRYDSQKDFTPIIMLGQVTPVMVVPASSPVRSVQDLIALAKSKPGELNYRLVRKRVLLACRHGRLHAEDRHEDDASSLPRRGSRLYRDAAERDRGHVR